LRVLLSRWAVSFLGTAILAGLAWVFGPLLPALEPALPRLLIVQGLLLAWAVANAGLDWRRRARNAALDAGISAAAAEGAAVDDSLRQALALLRARGSRGRLADLPLYAIIGPPGAGKTTALMNAGLEFPLAGELGRAPVPGVGGTRLCEWWFTRDAVLIDTAGRYTTQDSDLAVDRAGWNAFLATLRRARPRGPLNGVIVAIAVPDAVSGEAAAHAAAVARRIAELESAFRLSVPVYAVLTKADLVAGFMESFDDLDAGARRQVWGMTFPLGDAAPLAARVAAGFRDLAARLDARVFPRLAAEHRAERRAAIVGFPAGFAALEAPLTAFLEGAFGRGAALRGVYFASGTQEGTPIDRLSAAMARGFGIAAGRPAALRPEAGRSYFLGRLLQEVILGEAMLVREAPARRRARAALRVAGFAAILALVGGFAAALALNGRAATGQVEGAGAALAAYEAEAAPLAAGTLADGDLLAILPALDRARGLQEAVPSEPVAFGLGQAPKIEAGARAAYRNALVNGLLPRLLWRQEAEMRGELGQPAALYETTRVYLMLGGAGPLDAATVRNWTARDLARALPGEGEATARLLAHLDRLLAEPLPAAPLDGPLVAAARESIRGVPPAARVFASLQTSAAAAALPAWRPVDSLGLAGVAIFARASGRPMTEGVPGLYTAAGLRDVLLPGLAAAARRVASESWVTGRDAESTPAETGALEREVTALYAAEFARRWDAVLADLNIAPMATLPAAAQALYILSSSDASPLRALLRSVAAQVAVPGPIGERYAPVAGLTGGDGAALERALRLVADIQQQLAKIAALPVGTAPPAGGEDIGNALLAEAARLPQPLGRWLTTVGATAGALRTGNARRRIALLWNAPGGPAAMCAAAVARYPFAPAGTPLPLEELARVFGPGGALDGFLNTQLKPFVDTESTPWRAAAGAASPAPLDAAAIAGFARAAAIREALFPAGGANPSFQAGIRPSGPPRPATLTVGATAIASATPSPGETQVGWPPADGALSAGFAAPGVLWQETGPWALHRLVARGVLQPAPRPGRGVLTFGGPSGNVAYELATGPANPFAPGLFGGFRCPAIP